MCKKIMQGNQVKLHNKTEYSLKALLFISNGCLISLIRTKICAYTINSLFCS